jgi:hypothetical protein
MTWQLRATALPIKYYFLNPVINWLMFQKTDRKQVCHTHKRGSLICRVPSIYVKCQANIREISKIHKCAQKAKFYMFPLKTTKPNHLKKVVGFLGD